MADFPFVSDSDDEKAVDELLSQAMDHSVLEQVAAVNLCGVTDSVLPTHLETRFRKLKSFPASSKQPPCCSATHWNSASSSFKCNSVQPQQNSANAKSDSGSNGAVNLSSDEELSDKKILGFSDSKSRALRSKSRPDFGSCDSKSKEENGIFSPSEQNPDGKRGLNSLSPSKSSNLSSESELFSPSKPNSGGKKGLKLKSQSGSLLSRSDSSPDSLSPPRKSGCFWCSPKKYSKKKNKENRTAGVGPEWGKNWKMDDEFLSDLSTFSTKKQQKMLKKAMKEEEKISREAEKIVNWAKQASSRMNVSDFEDEVSDNDSTK